MKWIRERVLSGEVVGGTWIALGSCVATEIAGNAGFDWVVVDTEHGMGGRDRLLVQLQALQGTPAAPLVRVGSGDRVEIKLALDLGPSGIVVPQIESAAEADVVVKAMRYPPEGARGLSSVTRSTKFGLEFRDYIARANHGLLCVVQIETVAGLAAVDDIAAVEGVDVLFVGPLDLSASLGIMGQFDSAEFRQATERIISAAKRAGKAAGTLLATADQVEPAVASGFTFLGVGVDAAVLEDGMRTLARPFVERRKGST